MGTMSIFYTDECRLMTVTSTSPNFKGITTQTYDYMTGFIPCQASPMNTYVSKQRWGEWSQASLEVTMEWDGSIDAEQVAGIYYNGEIYPVENYKIIPQFLVIEQTITFAVRSDN